MRGGITIARLFGIRIGIDWSWILIFLLVTWNLAAGVFPLLHPEWNTLTNWGVAIVAAILFFLSILAHELAHSLVAIARGLPVRNIMLFMFGGVSNIEREPPDPKTEFLMAIVGPLTSIVLGLIFLFLGSIGIRDQITTQGGMRQALASLGPVQTLLLWLGPINIALGIFNMIPGFPLDGGRVARSIFWAITKNFTRATHWAARLGQVVAWALIITGIAMVFGIQVPFFGTGVVGGIWLIFIGWFLNNAALQSYRQAVVSDLLEGVPVSRIMHRDIPTVPPNITIDQLVDQYVMGSDERSFPVMENGDLIGLACLSDIRKVDRERWRTTLVNDIMTPIDQVDIVRPNEDASTALEKLTRRDIRQLPVVENGQLLGLLRRNDIIRWLQIQADTERSGL
ncbi:MAG TPA: site-2 protease family protein [Anaerolineaceae bacterium]|nr:site-2 protease family protein [Anaerolineaceae bacterium]